MKMFPKSFSALWDTNNFIQDLNLGHLGMLKNSEFSLFVKTSNCLPSRKQFCFIYKKKL